MKTFILLNVLIEITAGLIFLIMPTLIPGVSETDITGIGFARMYGAGAIAFAAINFQIWKMENKDIFSIAIRTIVIFHTGVTLAALISYNSGADSFLAVSVFHGIMMSIALYFLLKK
ncbi:MAG: hypothetical protein ACI94Y_001655 [Maribacter sp.]|jgi:hypothetical protein